MQEATVSSENHSVKPGESGGLSRVEDVEATTSSSTLDGLNSVQDVPEPVRMVMEDLRSLQAQLGAEVLDGLYSMVEASVDETCGASKKARGSRDKRYGEESIFKG